MHWCRPSLCATMLVALVPLLISCSNKDKTDFRAYEAPTLIEFTGSVASWNTIYVPAYSHGYYGDGHPIRYSVLLSIRNVSVDKTLAVRNVTYHDTSGKKAKTFAQKPFLIEPLRSIEFFVPERDAEGGSGANFLLEWGSEAAGSPEAAASPRPHVEAIMTTLGSGHAASFVTVGVPVD